MDNEREKRLAKTGQWFEKGVKTKISIWSNIVLPLMLIIGLMATVFIALD